MMSDERLAEIEAREQAATPGPWKAIDTGNTIPAHSVKRYSVGEMTVNVASGISPKTGDANFIAHSREDVPDLVDEVRQLLAKVAGQQMKLDATFDRLAKQAAHTAIARRQRDEAMCMVHEAPTIDPERHARWIERKVNDEHVQYICSNCKDYLGFKGRDIPNAHTVRDNYRYCRYCGARMDGGDPYA